ncbi:MAG: flagellar hook-associated protein FlgK [Phycisphaerales bacterium]|nr:flagellar hook-associated protein FlgK [Phycisphaerales bacterium]
MSLTGAMHIGSSALTASQLAIQVAGNNLANAATPGYSRQLAYLTPLRGDHSQPGLSVGQGVRVSDVRRQVDSALQSRLWVGVSNEAAAGQTHDILAQVESALNELSDSDLSSALSSFFNTWSERANLTKSSAAVVQQGQQLAQFLQRLRGDLVAQRDQVDDQITAQVTRADAILTEVARLNGSIAEAETSGGVASDLRDQRDSLITELSGYLDVSVVEQASGSIDVLVGSTPVVLGGKSRGLMVRRETRGGAVSVKIAVAQDQRELSVTSGRLGGLLASRGAAVNGTIDTINTLASQLIFQVNRIHSTGSNQPALRSTTASLGLSPGDRSLALNDPDNETVSGLPFAAANGGFVVRVKNAGTGAEEETYIRVDLDGRDGTGAMGTDDDTSADDIRAALDGVAGISASFTPDGRLRVTADSGREFSFGDDTSGALAVLGVNSYFTGKDASDIGVRQDLVTNPNQLSVGQVRDGQFVENGAAMQMVQLQDRTLTALGGRSLKDHWGDEVQRLGVATQTAATGADAASLVRENLDAQRASVSGVSVDEESVNLLTYQRQYQGAARFISVVDEMTQTLLTIV